LSLAIRETFGQNGVDICEKEADLVTVDVGCDEGFAKLLKVRATWVHGAPPCKTFSRARRSDQFASAKILRTEDRPQGFGSEAADVANKLALRMLEIAKGQMARGEFFSIENPLSSLLWKLKQYVKLAAEKDVRLVRVHQCMAGSMHKKETGVLTNAPWLADLLCDINSRPHHHVPLIGLVEDFREEDSKQVFYTELASEYPEGLCNLWAESFHEYCMNAEIGERREAPGGEEGGDRHRRKTRQDGELVSEQITAQSAEVCRKGPSEDRKGPSTSKRTALSLPERPLLRDTESSAEACRKGPSSGTRRTAQSAEACRKGPSEDWKGPTSSRQTALSAEVCRKGPQDPGHGAVENSRGEEASDIQRGDPLVTAKAGGELATPKV
jgi:hypothetical protein